MRVFSHFEAKIGLPFANSAFVAEATSAKEAATARQRGRGLLF